MKEVIINAVKILMKIEEREIFEKTRKRKSVYARQIIFYYLYNNVGWTFHKIGDAFNLNHSTVLFAVKNYAEKLKFYKDEKLTYLKFESLVKNQGSIDKELLTDFLKENNEYLSSELKEYLQVRL